MAQRYIRQAKNRRMLHRLVSFLACIVVFSTTYALILPAITMEKECELTEHVHDDACYTQLTETEIKALSCSYESLGVHVHSPACLGAEGQEICGYADFVLHTHDSSCTDESGALICLLPQL